MRSIPAFVLCGAAHRHGGAAAFHLPSSVHPRTVASPPLACPDIIRSVRHHSSLSASSSSTLPPPSSPWSPFASASTQRRRVPSTVDVTLLEPMGNGTFGEVFFARDAVTGRRLIAKAARAATPDDRAKEHAVSYLEIEAYVNSKLCPDRNDTVAYYAPGIEHVAPYLGECILNDTTYLIWEESGEYTLEDYIEMEDGWVQLASDLGVASNEEDGILLEGDARRELHNELAAEVLRQMLEGLAYCHSCGIVHRDVKPANILVDPKTRTLRFIDFGSACCLNSWTANNIGYKGENKGPRSLLYCAPEEFVDEEHPFAFDMYGAAITWLRMALSEDNLDGSNPGLSDEEDLFRWRIAVRDFSHNLVAWEEYATLHDELPHGWTSLFGTSRRGIQALRLLSNMMNYCPERRMSAAEALVGPYLNPDCDAEPPPELPPAMPYSIMSHIQRWKKDREVHDGVCQLEDLFTWVVAVELGWPLGLTLGPKEDNRAEGVQVVDVVDGTDAAKLKLRQGDSLLAIGPIDVETSSTEHVTELLEQWPRDKPVPLLLVRDSS